MRRGPLGAVLVVEREDRRLELGDGDGGGVTAEVGVDIAVRKRGWRADHADELSAPADPMIGLEHLGAEGVYAGLRRDREPEPFMLPSLLLVVGSRPVPSPAIYAQDFPTVSWVRRSARTAISVPVFSASQYASGCWRMSAWPRSGV